MKNTALDLVSEAFAHQVDKSNKPYLAHLFRVSENVKAYAPSSVSLEVLETVALLHDLLEDCPEWTAERLRVLFPENGIVEAVLVLTKSDDLSYEDYIQRIKQHPIARAVKLADLKDNMDVTRLNELTEKAITRLKKYHKAYVELNDLSVQK